MVELTSELISYIQRFKETFDDVVPLRELPQNTTSEKLMEAIKLSIEKQTNMLPDIFGYKELENNKTIEI